MARAVKRSYEARTRRRHAEDTRRRIIDEAGRLFAEAGYQRTTMEAIADAAGVSVESVYAHFRNKRTILERFLDVAVAGDHEPVAVLERPEVQQLSEIADQRELIKHLAHLSRSILERAAPAHRALRSAAASDPKIESLLEADQNRRHAGQTAFVKLIARRGNLGTTLKEATDIYWGLASPELYELLVRTRQWSPGRYEAWLGDSLARLLLEATETT
jgi:AcrR family transcriptional regulator